MLSTVLGPAVMAKCPATGRRNRRKLARREDSHRVRRVVRRAGKANMVQTWRCHRRHGRKVFSRSFFRPDLLGDQVWHMLSYHR